MCALGKTDELDQREQEANILNLRFAQGLEQWSSPFLMLRPFNTAPHVVVTPAIKLFSLLLLNCNFATVMDHNVNI